MNCRMRARAASGGMAYSAATISRYSRPVSDSKTAPDSGTKPTRRFTSIVSSSRLNPQIVAVPLVGASMPVSIFKVVDFPAPLGPRKPTICPAGISSESPSTAVWDPNRLVRLCREIILSLLLILQGRRFGDEKAGATRQPGVVGRAVPCPPQDGGAMLIPLSMPDGGPRSARPTFHLQP